jgi:pimeloyl-ACP methyl ester carboxylesterase
MIGKCWRHIRKHPRIVVACSLVLLVLVALNVLAFMHAYSMTHLVPGGDRPDGPQSLSAWQKAKVLLTGIRIPKPVNFATPADRGLPFSVQRFAGPSGIQLEAWCIRREKSKGLCILFHGHIACKATLLPEACAWWELGYDTLLVDFRGCGGSSGQVTTIGYLEAEDVVAAYQYAEHELGAKRPILYGISMGAAAVLRAVAGGDVDPRALVLECPFDRLLSTVENRFTAMGVPSFPAARLLVFWGGVQLGYSGFRHNPVDYAVNVHCPVLLMYGDRDPFVTRKQAEAIFENLAGEKQFVVFADTGHQPYLAKNPKQWRQAVAEFLEKHR